MTHPRLAALTATLLTTLLPGQQQVPSPEAFLGQPIGADHFLANYTQLGEYWRALARASDRMTLEEIGTTSYGQTMLLAVISSPANLAELDRHRNAAQRLCRARGLDDGAARALAQRSPAVIWIDAGLHATESVAAQNILELTYRMCARDDVETRRILDNVILLVCPANPDGMEMVANAYMATRRVGGLPVLYQRYLGHDNNRDFYMSSMPETKAINRMLYRRWYPQVVYNHHQTAPRGTIIFTPPFRDPFNYHFDPLVVRGIELVSAHMNARFAREGKPGVISRTGAPYSTWWNGGLRTTAYFHNMIGILTESFGSPNPTTIEQSMRRRLPSGDYPMPVPTQEWHARQTIEYLQTANLAILDLAARYREEMLFGIYQMGRNAIAKGSRDHWTATPRLLAEAERRMASVATAEEESELVPQETDAFADPALRDARAYVLPADQTDRAAAARFVGCLLDAGVEVHRATAPFEVRGASYPAGSWVVWTAQAFRAHVMDMFEPQWHPDDIGSSGEPVRPYDSAGWTPALSMDIDFDRMLDPFEAPLELIEEVGPPVPGRVAGAAAAGYLLGHADSNAYRATNRLLAAADQAFWLQESWRVGDTIWPAGTIFVPAGAAAREERVQRLAVELGLSFDGVEALPDVPMLALRPARVGLFDVYGGDMATGWTQWALEQFEFPVELVFGPRIHAGDLAADFDVLIFHTGLPAPEGDGQSVQRALRRGRPSGVSAEELTKIVAALPPFEDWARAAERLVVLEREKALPALRSFVEAGGTLIGLGSQASALIEHFELPVVVGTFTADEDGNQRRTRRSEFYIPTSLLRARVDTEQPIGYGVSPRLAVVHRSSPVFEVQADGVDVVARYASEDLLASGWAVGADLLAGKAAVLTAPLGAGRICLFGADVVFRGQPQGSLKMLLNAVQSSGASRQQLR